MRNIPVEDCQVLDWFIYLFLKSVTFSNTVTERHVCIHKNTHVHTSTMRYHVRREIFNLWHGGKNKTRQIFNLDREQGRIFSYAGDNAPFASAGLKRACREHTVQETDSSGVEISNYGSEEKKETQRTNSKKVHSFCVRSQTCVLLALWFDLKVWTELSETVRKTKTTEGEPEKTQRKTEVQGWNVTATVPLQSHNNVYLLWQINCSYSTLHKLNQTRNENVYSKSVSFKTTANINH